jgi:hypothetical protein
MFPRYGYSTLNGDEEQIKRHAARSREERMEALADIENVNQSLKA